MKKKTICFDLDNVLCKTKGNNYKKSIPIKKNIKVLNDLYKKNFYIKIFTARFMGRNNENISKAKKQATKITLQQLKKWQVNYDKLIFGKPSFDIYIDDKSFFYDKNWSKKLKKKLL
jgi:capsule biosynthesis phosphatase|tara:strand:+ start:31 stop:381 length:351 start_codon:yes stop_codon:yes gene_type:complete